MLQAHSVHTHVHDLSAHSAHALPTHFVHGLSARSVRDTPAHTAYTLSARCAHALLHARCARSLFALSAWSLHANSASSVHALSARSLHALSAHRTHARSARSIRALLHAPCMLSRHAACTPSWTLCDCSLCVRRACPLARSVHAPAALCMHARSQHARMPSARSLHARPGEKAIKATPQEDGGRKRGAPGGINSKLVTLRRAERCPVAGAGPRWCPHSLAATEARTCPPGSGADLHGVGLLLLPDDVDAGSPQQPRGAAGTCRRARR